MTLEDLQAADDLVKEMTSLNEAVTFLCSQAGCDLRDAMHWLVRVARANPDSAFAMANQQWLAKVSKACRIL